MIAIIIGAILIAWGLIELLIGKSLFISRMGSALFTSEDDDWLVWVVAGVKIVGGIYYIAKGLTP